MTDNELYKYFRERKNSLDEAPDDELRVKIESRFVPKKSNPTKILAIMALLAGAVYSIAFFFKTQDAIVPQEKITPVNERIYSVETKEAIPVDLEKNADTVKKKKVAKKENQVNGIIKIEHKEIVAPTPVVTNDIVTDEKQEQSLKDTLPGNNKITTSPGKIRIQSFDQLTKAQYDTLVARAVRHYSDKPKSILIIVAEGHKPYRKLVEVALREQNKLPGKAFAQINGFIRFMDKGDTIKESKLIFKSFFEPEIKKDTLPTKVNGVFKIRSKAKSTQDTLTSEFDF